jgi:hypothetical protein
VTRDAREVERKKVGLHSARRRKQFSKRWSCLRDRKKPPQGGFLLGDRVLLRDRNAQLDFPVGLKKWLMNIAFSDVWTC